LRWRKVIQMNQTTFRTILIATAKKVERTNLYDVLAEGETDESKQMGRSYTCKL
jgi:hypothetical protein